MYTIKTDENGHIQLTNPDGETATLVCEIDKDLIKFALWDKELTNLENEQIVLIPKTDARTETFDKFFEG